MATAVLGLAAGFLISNLLNKKKGGESSASVAPGAPRTGKAERTYIMIKPDGVQRDLVAKVIERFLQRGFKLTAIKMLQPTKDLASKHYAEHDGKPFFPKLVNFLSSGPVIGMVFEGKDVIKTGRTMIGATNPLASNPSTLRGDFAVDTGRNVIHGSDSSESAEREIALWFPEGTVEYKPIATPWIYE